MNHPLQVSGGEATPSPSALVGSFGGDPFGSAAEASRASAGVGDRAGKDDLVSRQLALLARQVRRLNGERCDAQDPSGQTVKPLPGGGGADADVAHNDDDNLDEDDVSEGDLSTDSDDEVKPTRVLRDPSTSSSVDTS